jgi:hypothetical protein
MVLLKVRIFTLGLLIGFSLLMPEASARPANPSIQTAQARQSAVDRVEQFQWQLIASPVMGLPTAEQLEALSPYLSNQLLTRIRAASLAQKAITQRSQIPEPPLIQGALFYSLFEGASGLVQVTPEGSGSSVLVTLEYMAQPNDPSPVRWTDRVMLVTEDQQPVIDDLQYLGQWDFSRQGSLSKQLDAVIASGK